MRPLTLSSSFGGRFADHELKYIYEKWSNGFALYKSYGDSGDCVKAKEIQVADRVEWCIEVSSGSISLFCVMRYTRESFKIWTVDYDR